MLYPVKPDKLVLVCLCLLLLPISAFAADGTSLPGLVGKIRDAAYGATKAMLVIGAGASLLVVGVKMLNGTVQSAPKFIYSSIAFSIGFVILSFFGTKQFNSTGSIGGSICAALQMGLMISAMISSTRLIVRFMRGTDGESLTKLIITLVASTAGVAILQAAGSSANFFTV